MLWIFKIPFVKPNSISFLQIPLKVLIYLIKLYQNKEIKNTKTKGPGNLEISLECQSCQQTDEYARELKQTNPSNAKLNATIRGYIWIWVISKYLHLDILLCIWLPLNAPVLHKDVTSLAMYHNLMHKSNVVLKWIGRNIFCNNIHVNKLH